MKKKDHVQAEVDAVLGSLEDKARASSNGVASGLAVRELENKEMLGALGPITWPPIGTTTRCRDTHGEYNDDSDKSVEPILA